MSTLGLVHVDLGKKRREKKLQAKLVQVNKVPEKKVLENKVPVRKVHKMAWICKKGTNDEISKKKCYELPSKVENSSKSTATLTTQTYPRGNQRLHIYMSVCLYIYIYIHTHWTPKETRKCKHIKKPTFE